MSNLNEILIKNGFNISEKPISTWIGDKNNFWLNYGSTSVAIIKLDKKIISANHGYCGKFLNYICKEIKFTKKDY